MSCRQSCGRAIVGPELGAGPAFLRRSRMTFPLHLRGDPAAMAVEASHGRSFYQVKVSHETMYIDKRYQKLSYIGGGAYGFVCAATDTVSARARTSGSDSDGSPRLPGRRRGRHVGGAAATALAVAAGVGAACCSGPRGVPGGGRAKLGCQMAPPAPSLAPSLGAPAPPAPGGCRATARTAACPRPARAPSAGPRGARAGAPPARCALSQCGASCARPGDEPFAACPRLEASAVSPPGRRDGAVAPLSWGRSSARVPPPPTGCHRSPRLRATACRALPAGQQAPRGHQEDQGRLSRPG